MIALIIICVILAAALGISITFNVVHGKIIIELEDALSEALDVCDRSYGRMTQVLEMPVAMATPEVRQVLREIENVRGSILYISNVLAEPYGGVVDEEVDDTKDEEKAQ